MFPFFKKSVNKLSMRNCIEQRKLGEQKLTRKCWGTSAVSICTDNKWSTSSCRWLACVSSCSSIQSITSLAAYSGVPSLGSRVTESQAYTDIHTKDRPALAGGPGIDKCVFCFGGRRGCEWRKDCSLTALVPLQSDDASRGRNTQGGGTQSKAVYGRHADLFMCVLMHEQPPSKPQPSAHTHSQGPQTLSYLAFLRRSRFQMKLKKHTHHNNRIISDNNETCPP